MSEQTSMNPDTAHESTDNAGVGPLLRASRQRVGEELRDVATMLRIRYPYLEAIEGGRYADLPGKTYAVGFVRAYAEHLGLDSEEVVRRYKAEIESGDGKNDLHFPTPMMETGIPGGAIVFIGFIVAVLAYGGWYLSTTEEGYFSDLIAPLPERLHNLVSDSEKPVVSETPKPQPAQQAVAPEQAVEKAPDPAPEPETKTKVETPPEAVPAVQAEAEETTPATASEPATPQPEPAQVVPQEIQQVVDSAAATPVSPVGPTPETPPTQPEQPEQPEQSEQSALSTPETPETSAAPSSEAPAETQSAVSQAVATVETVAPPPDIQPAAVPDIATQTMSPTAAIETAPPSEPEEIAPQDQIQPKPSRIAVRATSNSWIEVRDDFSNTILMSRLLSEGEVYLVPDQTGLSLHTGNAGALEISVDGATVPAIGADGDVRRGVQLDPDLLQAGTATR
jgi:cytoskeleton protein RodZ